MERRQFVYDFESGDWTLTELCIRYGVSRPTGHKWLERYHEEGEAGLEERSRRPKRSPTKTDADIARIAVRLREQNGWGARKIRELLSRSKVVDPARLPATSGACQTSCPIA